MGFFQTWSVDEHFLHPQVLLFGNLTFRETDLQDMERVLENILHNHGPDPK